MTAPDVTAHGFPHDLDGHPLLDWMGDDWVTFVVDGVLRELDAWGAALAVTCLEPPEMETRVTGSGTVAGVTLRVRARVHMRDGSEVDGVATFTPETVELDVSPVERMITLLREARALVGDDPLAAEIDGYLDDLRYGPVRKSEMAPLRERLGAEHPDLAGRFDAIEMVLRETWACRICDADAGTLELRESGELTRTSFTGVLTQRLPEIGPAWDAVNTSAPAIYAFDPELAPFWCPECAGVYCGEHWTRWDVFDDDGFHDSIRGRCPAGHERMLED